MFLTAFGLIIDTSNGKPNMQMQNYKDVTNPSRLDEKLDDKIIDIIPPEYHRCKYHVLKLLIFADETETL